MTDALGNKLYYLKDDSTGRATSLYYGSAEQSDAYPEGYSLSNIPVLSSVLKRDGFVNNGNYGLGGGGGAGSGILQSLAGAVTNETAMGNILGGLTSGGINYFLKSDKLNLSAVIQATKTDNRGKYLASPVIMTVDNKEATIDATSSRQFLTGWTAQSSSYAGAGMPSPQYTAKDIGVKLNVTPKINPNGTVMLKVKEEYNQVSERQTMKTPVGTTYRDDYIDVPSTRTMEADVLLENMQTVVFGGLIKSETTESESGIPILKDIPWIGKWLFSSVTKAEQRKELLVFLTPYVLDDAEAAQAEAKRRKRVLSDARPWDDHGWSASELADPIAKKELLRRLKDEAKKQDEDRQNRLAVEKWKLDRAKELEKMSDAERKFWIEQHKDELEKEEKEKFEKELKEQEDLKALAAELREKDMRKAEETIRTQEEAERKAAKEAVEGRTGEAEEPASPQTSAVSGEEKEGR
jgi:hypothetical protein